MTKAAKLLKQSGHEVFPFTPTGLDRVNLLGGQLVFADSFRSSLDLLGRGPLDYLAIGSLIRTYSLPFWSRKLLSPFVGLVSPILSGFIILDADSRTSHQLWALNAR